MRSVRRYATNMILDSIDAVIHELQSISGVGKRGAQKLALDILMMEQDGFQRLISAVQTMKDDVKFCKNCGYFCSRHTILCEICVRAEKGNRDAYMICVVEKPTDVLLIEKTQVYSGCFHVLGSLISPLDNVFPHDTNCATLFDRLSDLSGKDANRTIELILFLKPSFAADTTKTYLYDMLVEKQLSERVTITQLAQGLPQYYTAESLDQATLVKAMEDRRRVFENKTHL